MNIRKIVSLSIDLLFWAIDLLCLVFLFVIGFVLTLIVNMIVYWWFLDNFDDGWRHARHKAEHIGRYKDGKRVGKWEFHIESILDNGNERMQSLVGRYENGVRQGVWVYEGLSYLIYDKGIVRKYIDSLSFKKDRNVINYYDEYEAFADAVANAKHFAGTLREYDENGIFIQTRKITEQDRQEIADFLSK
ncbi:hypothetical protein [Helicobacter sp. T3_23-1056]